MSPEADRILDEALNLSERERVRIAASLIDSLESEGRDDVDPLWRVEVARRIADIDSGAVEMIPWPEARKQIFGE